MAFNLITVYLRTAREGLRGSAASNLTLIPTYPSQ
jgi:hypothetical protein